jgi:hypothetical protein
MMKKPSLFASPTQAAPIPHETEIKNDVSRIAAKRPPSREGKRVLSIYLPPEAWKQSTCCLRSIGLTGLLSHHGHCRFTGGEGISPTIFEAVPVLDQLRVSDV